MINEIIDLLPSADLKSKIKETDYRFSEGALLQIIYHYAPTFDKKLELPARFAETASPELAALANAYIPNTAKTAVKISRHISIMAHIPPGKEGYAIISKYVKHQAPHEARQQGRSFPKGPQDPHDPYDRMRQARNK